MCTQILGACVFTPGLTLQNKHSLSQVTRESFGMFSFFHYLSSSFDLHLASIKQGKQV